LFSHDVVSLSLDVRRVHHCAELVDLVVQEFRELGRRISHNAQIDLGQLDRRDKDRLSFKAVATEYIAAKEGEVRANTMRHLRGYLLGSYFKPLHGMALDRITRKDVAAQLVSIARSSGRPTAGRGRGALSAFFSWCMEMGLVDVNPVIGTPQPKANPPRDRVLSDVELAAIWNACYCSDDFSKIIRLLILLPCRRQEVGGMAASELDAGIWTIPNSRTKNGRSIKLPLMPEALAIIRHIPRRAGRDQLFGEFAERGFTDWHVSKRELDARLDNVPAWNIHDLRRSVATRMADLGVPPHVIEQILNHQSGHKAGVSGIYNRSSYEREVRQALAMWADHVRSLVEGGERKVVAFAPAP
jgi:integrase